MCGSRTCGFYMILPWKVGLKLKEREHRCPKNGHHGGFALKKIRSLHRPLELNLLAPLILP